MWALLPDSILHNFGIYYYPDRYVSALQHFFAFSPHPDDYARLRCENHSFYAI
jgi:hypothetical protein